jgi:hypothetical protein
MSTLGKTSLVQVVLDLGRRPEARFLGNGGGEFLRHEEVNFFLSLFFC